MKIRECFYRNYFIALWIIKLLKFNRSMGSCCWFLFWCLYLVFARGGKVNLKLFYWYIKVSPCNQISKHCHCSFCRFKSLHCKLFPTFSWCWSQGPSEPRGQEGQYCPLPQIFAWTEAKPSPSKGLAPPDFQTFRRLWSRVRSENPLFNCAVNPHQDSSCPTLYCPPLPFFQNTLPWISVIENIHTYSLSSYNNIVNCDSLKSK